jgi:hypothetical protein
MNEVVDQNNLTGSWSFSQLSDKAKAHARDLARDWNVQDEWFQDTFEDAVQIGAALGIFIDVKKPGASIDINFSGFWSQGDGASFAGVYDCKKDAVEKIVATAPTDEVLLALAKELTELQVKFKLKYGYVLNGVITHGSRASGCVAFDPYPTEEGQNFPEEEAIALRQLIRRFANWIYRQLEAEYTYFTSDEAIEDALECFLFDADGDIIYA